MPAPSNGMRERESGSMSQGLNWRIVLRSPILCFFDKEAGFMNVKTWISIVVLAAAFGCSGESKKSDETAAERAKESASELADAVGDMTKAGAEKVAEQAGEMMDSLSESMSKGKDAFLTEAQKQLDAMDGHIAELEKRASEASGGAKKDLEEAANKARKQKDSLKSELDKVRGAGEDAWKDAAKGFESGFAKMKDALHSK
jgi:gas vesicle protein